MNLKELLERNINEWERIGHPAMLERFVLRNGKIMKPAPVECEKMESGLCFMNATLLAQEGEGGYVEGFAWRTGMLPLPIHHAWINQDGLAYDLTWDNPDLAQYIGIEFPLDVVEEKINRSGYYGLLLNPNETFNTNLMFRIDPELKNIVTKITGKEIA